MTLELLDSTPTEVFGGVLSPVMPRDASPLERCNAEIATALGAVLTGSLPLEEALLYYRDWCWERNLILAEQIGIPAATFFSGLREQAARALEATRTEEPEDFA